MGAYKLNQPKQNTEAKEQSLEKKFVYGSQLWEHAKLTYQNKIQKGHYVPTFYKIFISSPQVTLSDFAETLCICSNK